MHSIQKWESTDVIYVKALVKLNILQSKLSVKKYFIKDQQDFDL